MVYQAQGLAIPCANFCLAGTCHCEAPYYLDSNENCVTAQECLIEANLTTTTTPIIPTTPTKRKLEMHEDPLQTFGLTVPGVLCGKPNEIVGCQPCQTCTYERAVKEGDYGFGCMFLCPENPTTCICIDGYVRDDDGTCVPIEECFEQD